MSLIVALAASYASAATCDAQLGKIGSLSADAAPGAFADLAKCDRKVAEANFNRYLERATDSLAIRYSGPLSVSLNPMHKGRMP